MDKIDKNETKNKENTNMKKKQFIKCLVTQLERLEIVEHISELANHGCYDEVDKVVADIDYTIVDQYTESDKFKKWNISDIPDQYVLTYAIWLYGCREHDEDELMNDWENWTKVLENYGDAGKAISKCEYLINSYESFANLIVGICEEN